MSQNEDTKTTEPTEAAQPAPTGAKALWDEVKSALNDSHIMVFGRLKDYYVEEELKSLTALTMKAFDKVRTLKGDLKKMKPDMKSRDKNGALVENWSTDAWDKKSKTEEQLSKLEKAVDTALSGNFEPLKKEMS